MVFHTCIYCTLIRLAPLFLTLSLLLFCLTVQQLSVHFVMLSSFRQWRFMLRLASKVLAFVRKCSYRSEIPLLQVYLCLASFLKKQKV
jgi:hypothetical protein